MCLIITIILTFVVCPSFVKAQDRSDVSLSNVDYSEAREYEIGDVSITGNTYSNSRTILKVAGLYKGMKIRLEKVGRCRNAYLLANVWNAGIRLRHWF